MLKSDGNRSNKIVSETEIDLHSPSTILRLMQNFPSRSLCYHSAYSDFDGSPLFDDLCTNPEGSGLFSPTCSTTSKDGGGG
jgi:hypothetical protein